jgi:hypothetical protein
MSMTIDDKARLFSQLHRQTKALLMPNCWDRWDPGSAQGERKGRATSPIRSQEKP